MFDGIRKTIGRFSEGFALTESERKELECTNAKNAENEEAVEQGYSIGRRQTIAPEIPGALDRVRRGLRNALRPNRNFRG
jgi:hypothetical protein